MKTLLTTIALLAMIIPIVLSPTARAASMSDTQSIIPTGSNNDNNSTSIIINDNNTNTEPAKMFITAIPDKPVLTRGNTEGILVKAETDNGTAIPDVTIQSIVVDYATGKQKVVLGGQTNDKGEIKIAAAIGPHAHPGQFLVTVVGEKDGFNKSTVSTGFAVSAKGSSSSGKCSGSSCK